MGADDTKVSVVVTLAVATVLRVTVSGVVEVSTAVTVVPVAIPVPLTVLPTEIDDASVVVTYKLDDVVVQLITVVTTV